MSIVQELQGQRVAALKNKKTSTSIVDEYTIISTLLGEIVTVGKNDGNRETTDAEALEVIKKFVKNINETLPHLTSGDERLAKAVAEKTLYERFLPKQLSISEMIVIMANIDIDKSDKRAKGEIMKYFSMNHNAQYNGKELAAAVDEFLKG